MGENDKKTYKKITSEMPISLAGAPFEEKVGALLKTPKPKKEEKERVGRETSGGK